LAPILRIDIHIAIDVKRRSTVGRLANVGPVTGTYVLTVVLVDAVADSEATYMEDEANPQTNLS